MHLISVGSHWLGHASLQTTSIYLGIFPDPLGRIKSAVNGRDLALRQLGNQLCPLRLAKGAHTLGGDVPLGRY